MTWAEYLKSHANDVILPAEGLLVGDTVTLGRLTLTVTAILPDPNNPAKKRKREKR